MRLTGTESNRDAVGARLSLRTDRRTLVREIASASGYLSQRSRSASFGLLAGETPQSLTVRWPAGGETAHTGLPAGGVVRIVEGRPEVEPESPRRTRRPSEPAGELADNEGTWLAEPVPAPDFALEGIGGRATLADFAGSKTLVNFWATWCPPCRAELADLTAHANELTAAGVKLAAISVDDPADRDKVRQLASESRLPFPVLFADDATVNAYTVLNEQLFDRRRSLAIPTRFLLDEQGRIVKVYRGETSAARMLADAKQGAGSALPFEGRWIRSGVERDFVELATAFAERRLAAPARVMFEEAVRRGVQTPDLYNNLAGLSVQDGRFDEAEGYLRKSLELAPRQTSARVNLASALLQQGRTVEAEALLRGVLEAQPDDAEALGLLGSAAFSAGRLDEAEALYRRGLALEPERAELHENLGSLLASRQRFGEAIGALEQAQRLGRGSVRLFSNLGALYMQTGRAADGLRAFEQAVEADPADYGANLNLALYYLQAGDRALAREWARKAAAIDPRRPEAGRLLEQIP